MIKAVGYPRVSGAGQHAKGHSLEAQAADIEEFCRQNNIHLVAHYREVESAKAVASRPVFKAMLRHAYKDPEITLIIFNNLDRYARNVIDNELVRQALAKKGKQIISVQQKYLTPLTPDQEDEDLVAALQHAAVDNERERKKIKKRFLRGKQQKVENGGWAGHRPPYECDVVQGELVINKERAAILRHIKRLHKLGSLSLPQICEYLNGNNRMLNPDGTRGRIMPAPGTRVGLRKRTGGYIKKPRGVWTVGTLWGILNRDKCREKQAQYRLRSAS